MNHPRSDRDIKPLFAAYLAVIPAYRQACVEELLRRLGPDIELYASDAHLDATVTTGIRESEYTSVRIARLGDKAFLQQGHWRRVLGARTAILDLNPRSVTAWILLLARTLLGRRTLVWGHLHPRDGASGSTAGLRRTMRRLASGTITYTYTQASQASRELPGSPVWVAPNSLYRQSDMLRSEQSADRSLVLYVGRLEKAKKADQIVPGFAAHSRTAPDTKLVVVGEGSVQEEMRRTANELGISDRVTFTGKITDVMDLRTLYGRAFCSLSPGFAGLGLTQSLGFGVPQVISRNEPHSPEIELAETDAAYWFATDSAESMGEAISLAFERRLELPLPSAQNRVHQMYSAEAMANGLVNALMDRDPYGGTEDV